jgi:DNA polymerase theta
MRGRAGRKGKDEVGETYLCCQTSDLEDVTELMEADIPSVESRLMPGKCGIKRCVAIKLETTAQHLHRFSELY